MMEESFITLTPESPETITVYNLDCHPEQHQAEMRRLEQGARLHRLRRRRRTPQGR